jgi:hypothetical protein
MKEKERKKSKNAKSANPPLKRAHAHGSFRRFLQRL